MDINDLAKSLAKAGAKINVELAVAVESVATKIENTAKEEFGIYQDPIGDFNGWADLKESTIAERVQKGFSPNDPLLRTGELRDSIQHETMGLEAVVGSKDPLMLWQELGTEKGIPPRPVLGPASVRSEEEIHKAIAAALAAAFKL